MIGMMKGAFSGKSKTKEVVFDGFRLYGEGVKGILCMKNGLNCSFKDGVLRTGSSLANYYSLLGNEFTSINYANVTTLFSVRFLAEDGVTVNEKMAILSQTGFLYFYNESTKTAASVGRPGTKTQAVYARSPDGEQKWIVAGERGVWTVASDFTLTKLKDITNSNGAVCVCKNRVFLGQKTGKLLYSSPLAPWDFTETIDDGGKIELPLDVGTPIDLKTVDDYVYIFCPKAILRLRVAGSARDFELERLSYDGKETCCGSFAVSNGGIVFLARDGLWRAEGRTVEKVSAYLDVQPKEEDQRCQSAVSEGRYVVRYMTSSGTRKTLATDKNGENGYFCRDLESVATAFDKMIFLFSGKIYSFQDAGENADGLTIFSYQCESAETDFETEDNKLVKALAFRGKGEFTLGVYCDGKYREYPVVFENGGTTVKTGLRGKRFSFVFALQNGCEIRRMSATVETLG